jgi:TRAP-type C4-dicarboxylate transport system permease small subunit
MVRALSALRRLIDGVNTAVGWTLAALLAVMTALIAWQVFARYVMGDPLTFSEEIARFAMVWMTMLGAGYAFRAHQLISVDIAAELGGPTVARVLGVIVPLVALWLAVVMAREGIEVAERVSRQVAPSTRVSMVWLYAALPAGAALVGLNVAALLIDAILGDRPHARAGG